MNNLHKRRDALAAAYARHKAAGRKREMAATWGQLREVTLCILALEAGVCA